LYVFHPDPTDTADVDTNRPARGDLKNELSGARGSAASGTCNTACRSTTPT
jgi:hypothetical protein